MLFRLSLVPAVCLSVAAAWSQQAPPQAPIVQPGAPGQNSKTLPPGTSAIPPQGISESDTSFMQGMIMHHSQAVEMTALMPTHTKNKELLSLGKRISISQTDEMKFMKQWLEDRGKPTTMDMGGIDMSKMDMSHMTAAEHAKMMHPQPMMMPGMLTPEQMKALAKASGPLFDHLFLTGMIQHHTGALTMVKELFEHPGAGQDPQLFDFATDVDNTQQAEINIMQGMLNKEKK
jgi:uncharacterized protein (DUF305 family)